MYFEINNFNFGKKTFEKIQVSFNPNYLTRALHTSYVVKEFNAQGIFKFEI